ncbi:MAG: hypothetical protein V2B15_21360 [Bacteroidota bacterium]
MTLKEENLEKVICHYETPRPKGRFKILSLSTFWKMRKRTKIIEYTDMEKEEFYSSMKDSKLTSPNGSGIYVKGGSIKELWLRKERHFYPGRFILNISISAVPTLFGILFSGFMLYGILLSIVSFFITSFIIRPFKIIERKTEGRDSGN